MRERLPIAMRVYSHSDKVAAIRRCFWKLKPQKQGMPYVLKIDGEED